MKDVHSIISITANSSTFVFTNVELEEKTVAEVLFIGGGYTQTIQHLHPEGRIRLFNGRNFKDFTVQEIINNYNGEEANYWRNANLLEDCELLY